MTLHFNGKVLRRERSKHLYCIGEMARFSGLSVLSIRNAESSKGIRAQTVRKILATLEIPVDKAFKSGLIYGAVN
jgi:predicted transcriptional regulator